MFRSLIFLACVLGGSEALLGLPRPPLRKLLSLRGDALARPPTTQTASLSVDQSNDDLDAIARERGLEIALWKTMRRSGMGKADQAKGLLRKYGAAYLLTSISLAIVSYAMCFTLISRGVDIAALLRLVGIDTIVSRGQGTAAIAYAVHKAASPIRFAPTVALTPIVSGVLRGSRAPEKDNDEQ